MQGETIAMCWNSITDYWTMQGSAYFRRGCPGDERGWVGALPRFWTPIALRLSVFDEMRPVLSEALSR